MDYAPNSHKSKEEKALTEAPERKKLEKVVTGKVKTKKRNEISKLGEIFIAEDARNVKSYILMEVLVPAVKKAISDIVTNGIDMLLFGEGGRTKRTSSASTVSYRNYYDQKDITRRDYSSTRVRTRTGYSYDDIILETRGEAEEVLARMDELIETYGIVSVADMYDLVGKTCNYTDNKYGWTNILNAEPIHVRDGYMLKMPKAGPIN